MIGFSNILKYAQTAKGFSDLSIMCGGGARALQYFNVRYSTDILKVCTILSAGGYFVKALSGIQEIANLDGRGVHHLINHGATALDKFKETGNIVACTTKEGREQLELWERIGFVFGLFFNAKNWVEDTTRIEINRGAIEQRTDYKEDYEFVSVAHKSENIAPNDAKFLYELKRTVGITELAKCVIPLIWPNQRNKTVMPVAEFINATFSWMLFVQEDKVVSQLDAPTKK
jgi:hypothetical protein